MPCSWTEDADKKPDHHLMTVKEVSDSASSEVDMLSHAVQESVLLLRLHGRENKEVKCDLPHHQQHSTSGVVLHTQVLQYLAILGNSQAHNGLQELKAHEGMLIIDSHRGVLLVRLVVGHNEQGVTVTPPYIL